MFKNMTVGKQVAFGFSIILVFLAGIAITSYTGVGGIVNDAVDMIQGEGIIGEMKQKEIDHLNWLAHLSEYMTNPDVKELKIELDHTKCGLGKWLYGEERKNAESEIPVLAPLFKSLEEPHRLVHESAADIAKNMNKLNVAEEMTIFYRVERAHRIWMMTVINEILAKKDAVSVELDHRQCGLGKWLYGGEADALAREFPEFAPFIERIKEPHRLIHEGGKLVNAKLAANDYDGAMAIVNEEIVPNLQIVCGILKEARDLVREFEKGQNEAAHIFVTVTEKNLEKCQEIVHQVSETVEKNMVTQEALLGHAGRLKTIVTIVGLMAFVLGIALAFFIARGLVNSLSNIANMMGEGADQVACASGEVSSASQSLAEGAAEQASAIEETSSSLEEMSSMTKQNADNAQQADSLMKEAGQAVVSANESMSKLTTSMGEISHASEETSKIIKTIDEIAFQTNLLALNAAVEAARAGEHGAGFAVVAEEVRNLAMRSAEAAKNTAVLIEDTVTKVKNGSGLVGRASEVFGTVADSSSKVGELVGEIAAASNEQAQGIGQVNNAVTEMDKVTQQNAANAEETASASEELSAQAEQMKKMVGDLMVLVGGSGGGVSNRQYGAGSTGKRAGSAVGAIRKVITPSATKSKALVVPKTREVKPDEVIPMDDDFKDF